MSSDCRFGLLHRIPPLPENREPGSLPAELSEEAEGYEEQELFVPADLTNGVETPEQAEERRRWEEEEWEREAYARNYVHQAAANQTSPSAYVPSSDSKLTSNGVENPEEKTVNVPAVSPDTTPPIQAPTPVHKEDTPQRSVKEASWPSTPIRSPSSFVPRASTPTQSRPSGYHINGEFST